MTDSVIRLNNISKDFHIYNKPLDRLLENFFSRSVRHKKFKALSNISFEIKKGETVGLVGANGAGKSTLLQVICGTLNASAGKVAVDGRISALLELGSGFNLDFTGRENIYFFGAMQGMKKIDIEEKIDDILEFADIGEFIEQPVKTYSSGMYVRLAFAAAIHVDPDILIVDEALAVGDEAFQNKCYSRINKMRNSGVTVLFVTHSPQTVMSLCDRAMLFEHGQLLLDSNPKDVISCYQKLLYAPAEKKKGMVNDLLEYGVEAFKNKCDKTSSIEETEPTSENISNAEVVTNKQEEYFDPGLKSHPVTYESKGAKIINPHIQMEDGTKVNVLRKGTTYYYCYKVELIKHAFNVRFAMVIKMLNGTDLGGYISAHSPHSGIEIAKCGNIYDVRFKFDVKLNPGVYAMNSGVRGTTSEEEEFLIRVLDTLLFRVLPIEEQKETCFIDFDIKCDFSEVLVG
ncbi:ABC transporter ATP-binding protein [Vibrio splendidus]|uniref:ABC transporter ATP-binding protein n=1 Tax=Vibrio splendidus TaxID=29497 RepID=UPI000C8535BC|nr:ABC transporter ATP-binding protein [Vibrio splendidus]PMO92211.1 hypothetical protein BCS97_20085 [Vibrio splendidus]PMP20108.1 hypothetical protein BCS89_03755 [Vibrio splendidus]PMP34095.1 hypothetical protein BCS87_20685 [Vibrio splendidus]PMP36880.1 hypothetical protein BCS88_05710 [Vibrio splendidus]PMP45688.1 hypothetical protein BCS85_16615 [Vibrio splendidus]